MNRYRLRIRTCCLAATIMLAGSGSMAVNAAPAAGLSDELSTTISSVTKESTVAGGTLTFAKAVSDSQKADEIKKIQTILPRTRVRRQKMRLRL